MLGLMGSSGGDGATRETRENGGGSSEDGGPSSLIIPGGGVIDESDRSGGGGNRWPRQETLALLKIRSDMDGVFKDANLKGPLWEEVSRKMGELGFQRNPKKCKEKFENVYKYHKRTKDGRASKPDAKSYRFFDQLEAFEAAPPTNPFTATPPPPTAAVPPSNLQIPSTVTVSSSTSPTPLSIVPPIPPKTTNINIPINSSSPFQQQQQQLPHQMKMTKARPSGSTSSSSTSSDEDIQRRRGRKRKWKDYFERLMREVVLKQEELQSKFLDELERRERDRMARDEAWRAQESARIDRERNLLVEERSMTAAKDKAVIAFLQKVTREHNLQIPIINNNNNNPTQQAPPPPPPAAQPALTAITPSKTLEIAKIDEGNNNITYNGDGFVQARSSSRWPKAEIEALIKLRTSLDIKYQENGPKGPLWEEISGAMAKIGYSRSPKRCKEKWENINKYYKKVKESNRKRPEDSKTCPYFQLLEEIYKEKAIHNLSGPLGNPGCGLKPDNPNMGAPIMARPEQQWPLSEQRQQQDSLMFDDDVSDQNNDDEDDEDEDEGVAGYEIIPNKPPPPQPSLLANTVE